MKLSLFLSALLGLFLFESIIYQVVADDWKHLKKKLIALGILSGLSLKKKYIIPFPLPLPVPLLIKKVSPPIVLPPKKFPVLVPKPVPVYHLVPKFVPIHHHKQVFVVPKMHHETKYHHHHHKGLYDDDHHSPKGLYDDHHSPKGLYDDHHHSPKGLYDDHHHSSKGLYDDHHQPFDDHHGAYSWQPNDWSHEQMPFKHEMPFYSESNLYKIGDNHGDYKNFFESEISGHRSHGKSKGLKGFQGHYDIEEHSSNYDEPNYNFKGIGTENFNHIKLPKGDLLMSSAEHIPITGNEKVSDLPEGIIIPENFSDGHRISPEEIKSIIGDLKNLNDEIKMLNAEKFPVPDVPIKKGDKKIQIGEIRLRPEELKSIIAAQMDGSFQKRTL